MVRRVLALLAVVAISSACVGLRPRTTLEGKPFNASQVQTVRYGLAEPEVRGLLGDPFEVTTDAQHTVWRYYERFTPRGCDPNPPVMSQEFRVTFLAGRVESTEPALSVATR
jgi:outer membrane protein assembly factor BamE (lipoprotein component of BamABCDE complex)